MKKVFVLVVIGLAVLLGILEAVLPTDRLADLLIIQKFFTGMIPILGVGALIKYIACCHMKD